MSEGIRKVTDPLSRAQEQLIETAVDSMATRGTLMDKYQLLAGIMQEAGELVGRLVTLRDSFTTTLTDAELAIRQAQGADKAARGARANIKRAVRSTSNEHAGQALRQSKTLIHDTAQTVGSTVFALTVMDDVEAELDQAIIRVGRAENIFRHGRAEWSNTVQDATAQGERALVINDNLDQYKGTL